MRKVLMSIFIGLIVVSSAVSVLAATETVLTQDVPADYSYFGYSVAASNDRAMVGAQWDSSFGVYTGAVYMFEQNGTGWEMTQKLGPSDPTDMMWYGNAVAIDGDYAVVGAIGADGTKGAAYVYFHNGTEWIDVIKLAADDGEVEDFFGFAVDISGMEVVVGAYWDSPKGEHSGSAYQFCGG